MYRIPTREEHRKFIRKLWKICISAACGIFLVTGGVVVILFLLGYDSRKVVEISTSIFQVLILSYGLGFFVPAFLTSLFTMSLGIEMSRKSLEIGEKTSQHIDRLQAELTPVISDLKAAVSDARSIVAELREKELGKITKAIDKLSGNGSLEETLEAIRKIPVKLDELIQSGKKNLMDNI